jgi:hypothetical protein
MDNWYDILKVSENIESDELERLADEARLEHHPDRHVSEPADVKAQHAAQLRIWLEGTAFLLNKKARKRLNEHLKAVRAAAKAEEERRRNAEEAKRRGDADDLRAQFKGRPRPTSRETSSPRSSPGVRPPPPPRPPARPLAPSGSTARSPGSEAGVVLALDELPPIDWGGVRAVAGRLIGLVVSLALLALPFYIKAAVGEVNEYGLVDLGCAALFFVGLIAVACAVGAIFTRD